MQNRDYDIELEPEVKSILKNIEEGQNFLLSGGAGSGKTYSLVQTIKYCLAENPSVKVGCITYTNAAVTEILSRVNHESLTVGTIHDFLWMNIKQFQEPLKDCLLDLVRDKKLPIPEDVVINRENLKNISYKQYDRFTEGVISHDSLLQVANRLFCKYVKLADILKSRYPIILVDEYQDTSPLVIEILLKYLSRGSQKGIVGLFGDSMQNIYDDTIGALPEYEDFYKKIEKKQNRRNPQKIISLANKLRLDQLSQEPSDDLNAPNMRNGEVIPGRVIFFHSATLSRDRVSSVKDLLSSKYNWNFEEHECTKELNLTQKLIADKAGFKTLLEIYKGDGVIKYYSRFRKLIDDTMREMSLGEVIDYLSKSEDPSVKKKLKPTKAQKQFISDNANWYDMARSLKIKSFNGRRVMVERLLDYESSLGDFGHSMSSTDELIKHLFKLQDMLTLYKVGEHNAFLRLTNYEILSMKDKRELRKNIEVLLNSVSLTIGEVIQKADKLRICVQGDGLVQFRETNRYLYNRVMKVNYKEFQGVYDYIKQNTPYSTQHKTKGSEYDNVLVVLDNGNWNKYKFKSLFPLKEINTNKKSEVRARKIFYVCCTRAKRQLAILCENPSQEALEEVEELLGAKSVINLDEIS